MAEKNIISFSAPDKMATAIDRVRKNGGYISKSDAVRDIIRKGLEVMK